MTKVMTPSSKKMKYVAGACKVARISLGLVDQLHIPRCAPLDFGLLCK